MPRPLAVVLLALSGSPALAQDSPAARYYFLLFAGQSVPFVPRTAHTWATWAKATPTADGPVAVEAVTISWLPTDANVQPLKLRSVAGRNWTLDETFGIMAKNCAQVSLWGPFEVCAERYCLARKQAALLASGGVRFRTLDSADRSPDVMNCVRAVTLADPVVSKYVQPVLRVGEPGTSNLAEKYLKHGAFVGGAVTHDGVIPAVGADRYPVIRRAPWERIPRE